jgi:hypothetical protein
MGYLTYTLQTISSPNASLSAPSLPDNLKITNDILNEIPDSTPAPDQDGARRSLRIFMPADSPHLNLCKTLMSALALGYPAPTMLNWHGDFNHPEWHFGGSHIAKLESLLNVLEDLLDNDEDDVPLASENDLVLLVDGYDIWFQLPPEILIKRYHQLNREADARNLAEWQAANTASGHTFPIPPPAQRIVVTPAKHCSPASESGSDPHYQHWPASPMREDLYGEDTDEILPLLFDPARRYKKLRPRCVNSGFIMGTAGALRDAMERAKEKIIAVERSGRQIWSDQALLGEIIGEQEMFRIFMRETARTWNGHQSPMPNFPDADIRHIGEAAIQGQRFEFGIGLDYNFTTIPPTCSAEEDAYFVSLNDTEAVHAESRKAGVPDPVRITSLPSDLAAISDPLPSKPWSSLSLYTDFYQATIPIGIHHNAYINNLKQTRVKEWWSKMWFYPYLRDLVTKNMKQGHEEQPLATVGEIVYWKSTESWDSVTYWDPKESPRGAFVKLTWDEVCQKGDKPWTEQLFGDGKGDLVT